MNLTGTTKSFRTDQEAYNEAIEVMADELSSRVDGLYFGNAQTCADVFGQSIAELLGWENGYSYFSHGPCGTLQGCRTFEDSFWASCAVVGADADIYVATACKGGWKKGEWSLTLQD